MATPFGSVDVSRGELAGVEVLHVSRHGAGHVRLSNHVTHRANIWALHELGATRGDRLHGLRRGRPVAGARVAGRLRRSALHLQPAARRLAVHVLRGARRPGAGPLDPARRPVLGGVRAALLAGAADSGHGARDGGVYGHVDGPRFNTPAEIAQLAACGVTAVSQTGGPETVLCGELELPFALIGFVTDYANEVDPRRADAGGDARSS